MAEGLTHRRTLASRNSDLSESDLSDAGAQSDADDKTHLTPHEQHSKGDKKLAKIVKRLVFGTLLLFLLCGIIAAGHLWTLIFVRGCTALKLHA